MDEAMKLVEQLAAKMGVAVEYLWSILVKQKYADGIVHIILSVVFIGIAITLAALTPRIVQHAKEQYLFLVEDRKKNGTGYNGSYWLSSYKEDNAESLMKNFPTVAIVVGIAALLLAIIFVVSGVKNLINPEYYALKEILNTISYAGG